MYVGFITTGSGADLQLRTVDMVLRKTDKTQFFTGVLIKDAQTAYPKDQCIFARLDRYGNN
jgi:hypothetical protein